ncbi:hypothetical protein POM88_027925 [Heracleum sosnowskyi]|uniref:Uncharacterized protein n=1 Tax=Heracleum sosnowskyi TaxID=360622 RepID=A0AAD8MPZ8_9APIA|nr:hypothetical protein POM88_027925 [Heracleum sosnowskyi]
MADQLSLDDDGDSGSEEDNLCLLVLVLKGFIKGLFMIHQIIVEGGGNFFVEGGGSRMQTGPTPLVRFTAVSKEGDNWKTHPFLTHLQSYCVEEMSGFFCQNGFSHFL